MTVYVVVYSSMDGEEVRNIYSKYREAVKCCKAIILYRVNEVQQRLRSKKSKGLDRRTAEEHLRELKEPLKEHGFYGKPTLLKFEVKDKFEGLKLGWS